MPPKADKEKKEKPVKGDEGGVPMEAKAVAELTKQDYFGLPAFTDVSINLKGKVTKPEAQKALLSLAGKGSLTMKPYGKQTIFVYNQSQLPVLDPQEMANIDEALKTAKTSLEEKRKELKTVSSDLAALEALPRTDELSSEIERITEANDLSMQSLKSLRGEGTAPPMSSEDTAKIDDEWTRWRKEWTSRRKVYNNLFGLVQECGLCGTNRADFEDEQGIETETEEARAIDTGEFGQPANIGVKRKSGNFSSASAVPRAQGAGDGGGGADAGAGAGASAVGGSSSKHKRVKT